MLMEKAEFAQALASACHGKSNYQCNIDHNAGRWCYWFIQKCSIGGLVFYCSNCPGVKTANTNISSVKRAIARYVNI